MASALPSLSGSVVLVRSLDENLAEHALMRGHRKSSAPATVLVVEGTPKDLPESLSNRLEASRGNAKVPTFIYNEDERICGVKETEGGFCLVGKDGLVATTFRHIVCAPDTMESPLGQLLRTSSQTGSGASSVASGSSFGMYELHTQDELAEWIGLEEGQRTMGADCESESSPEQGRISTAGEEESDDDEENEGQPVHVPLKLAEDLLTLMQTVKIEGGADPEEAEEAEELAGRLDYVCQSKEAAVLSSDDVYLLQDYFGEYIFRLDEERRILDNEGVSQEEQWPIFTKIGRAYAMMGPLIRIARRSDDRRLTSAEAAQLGSLDGSDSDSQEKSP